MDPDLDGIQVNVTKVNKKKGQEEPKVVGQITIEYAVFTPVPSDGTCDPNDPNP